MSTSTITLTDSSTKTLPSNVSGKKAQPQHSLSTHSKPPKDPGRAQTSRHGTKLRVAKRVESGAIKSATNTTSPPPPSLILTSLLH